ncbi:MAG: NAD(P)-dependent glycerol-3-phosphate dehydrogenase [Eubacteriaceae bacterium]|nr:NAD(P)-dependent glycerol-3-phosphate dehydrogenase [Eubacteriaceae bacterium]
MYKIGVLGPGTWGIALARMLANKGYDVTVWSALEKEIDELNRTWVHPNLPEMKIPDSITFTKDIEQAASGKDLVVFAVASPYVRSVAAQAVPYFGRQQLVVDVAKGIEAGSLMTMSQIIEEEAGKCPGHEDIRMVVLSGPTHAEEVAVDLPTVIVSASKDPQAAQKVQEIFTTDVMRVYTNDDVYGVELCGALKNVMALAAGMSGGLGYGDNARAALITRGITELARLGRAMGCEPSTFYGLTGMGDLIVTATSEHSRNNRCGYLIGSGVAPGEAVKQIGMVVEGINALEAAVELADKYGVEMPIVNAVDSILKGKLPPREAVNGLMNRRRRSETEG